jgi:membrane protein DedA with SNARE-associated domain
MIESLIAWITHLVEVLGYPGIFLEALLESTFVPLACEITMIPAGYLVFQGKMNGPLVYCLAIAGTMTGSLLNYAVARSFGRYALVKYGKYFLMNENKLEKMEGFFRRHGPISIFLGRLVFGVRHFISFPAGLAKMDVGKFSLYTALGAGFWMGLLLILGYQIGNNQALVHRLMPEIKVGTLIVVALIAFVYYRWKKSPVEAPQAIID